MGTIKHTASKQKSAIRSHIETLERPLAAAMDTHISKPPNVAYEQPQLTSSLSQFGVKQQIQLLTIQQVQEILNVKRTFIVEHTAAGTMPAPLKMGKSRRASIRFLEHEIVQYVMDLAAQREQVAPNADNQSSVDPSQPSN